MKKDYQMITVCDYVKMLENEITYIDDEAKDVKKRVEKYLLSARRAATNAKILERLLA